MTESEASIVLHVPEGPSRGGRKKKYLKIEAGVVANTQALKELRLTGRIKQQRKVGRLPELMKLSNLPGLLGVSKASVYRMPKNGLRTIRPTSSRGDQYVRREDLEEYLAKSDVPTKRRKSRSSTLD